MASPVPPLKTKEAAAALRTTEWKIRSLVAEGRLRAIRLSEHGPYRISAEDVARMQRGDAGFRLVLRRGGLRAASCIHEADGRGYSLRRVVAEGKGEIQVSEVPLTHKRLGDVDVKFAYGEGKVGGRDALLVATEDEAGKGQLTIRFRPLERGRTGDP